MLTNKYHIQCHKIKAALPLTGQMSVKGRLLSPRSWSSWHWVMSTVERTCPQPPSSSPGRRVGIHLTPPQTPTPFHSLLQYQSSSVVSKEHQTFSISQHGDTVFKLNSLTLCQEQHDKMKVTESGCSVYINVYPATCWTNNVTTREETHKTVCMFLEIFHLHFQVPTLSSHITFCIHKSTFVELVNLLAYMPYGNFLVPKLMS